MIPVPRLWPGSTVVVIAGGPSLTEADVARCQGQHVIAVKDAIRLAPWAEVLYGCDKKWWQAHPETRAYSGLKYGLEHPRGRPDVHILRNAGQSGLETDPSGVRTLKNSGGQAINVAAHLIGSGRIVLLGFDMQPHGSRHHWFGWHSYGVGRIPPYALFLPLMETLVKPLAARGIAVVNASRVSALTCFPKVTLEEALA